MRRYLDLTSWILLFFFAPFTVLIFLSQNTIPGDFFYPVKRGLENMVLVAASVSPTTKVAFRTDLTQKRFSEAQQLLVLKADTTAYNGFIDEVFSAKEDLSKLSSSQDRIESSEKLIAKIEEYETQLTQIQNQVQIAQALPSGEAGSSSAGQNQPVQPPAAQTIPPTTAPTTTTVTPQPIQTSAPSQPVQTPQIVAVTPAPPAQTTVPTTVPTSPPLAPSVTNVIANNPVKAEEVKEKIKDTKEHLEKIKEDLKKEKEDARVEEKVKEEQKKLRENLREENSGRNENDN